MFYLLRICDYKTATQHVDRLDSAMKADIERTRHIQELRKELEALNFSLSRADLNYRDRSALSEKRVHLEEQLSSISGLGSSGKDSLEPAYFGNVKRACGEKLELAPPPIDGEWLPKGAIYALVDLTFVAFSRPKGLFKDCGKRIQSGIQTIQGECNECNSCLSFFFVLLSLLNIKLTHFSPLAILGEELFSVTQ